MAPDGSAVSWVNYGYDNADLLTSVTAHRRCWQYMNENTTRNWEFWLTVGRFAVGVCATFGLLEAFVCGFIAAAAVVIPAGRDNLHARPAAR